MANKIFDYNSLYKSINADHKLVSDFFAIFSRFEYSLKRNKFIRGDENHLFVNWEKFAKHINDVFDQNKSDKLKNAVDYLSKHPPRKQVLKDNDIRWKPIFNNSANSIKGVLLSIRTVRNNLFHGAKYPNPDGEVEEPAHNSELMKSCIIILEECLELDFDLKSTFFHFDRDIK